MYVFAGSRTNYGICSAPSRPISFVERNRSCFARTFPAAPITIINIVAERKWLLFRRFVGPAIVRRDLWTVQLPGTAKYARKWKRRLISDTRNTYFFRSCWRNTSKDTNNRTRCATETYESAALRDGESFRTPAAVWRRSRVAYGSAAWKLQISY